MSAESVDRPSANVTEDAVDEIRGMTELYNPECCLVESVKGNPDWHSKAKDLDDKKKDLTKTYLDFNYKLWTGKIKHEETPQTEEIIRNKLQTFQEAVKKYGIMEIYQKHCVLYREFEINGVSRWSHLDKLRFVQSAFTNINFSDNTVSLKTTKVKMEKENERSEKNKQRQETVILNKSRKEETEDYLDRYYPTDGTFRIPPSLEYEDEIKVSKELQYRDILRCSNDDVLENRVAQYIKDNHKKCQPVITELFAKRRGYDAENEILAAFEKWGRDTGQNMFIFGGFDYKKYLKNVPDSKCSISEQGEFDVLIISQQLGVIFVEVKGSVGGKYLTKGLGRENNFVHDGHGGHVNSAVIKDTSKGGNDHQCNVAKSEGRRDRQSREQCPPPKIGHDIKPADFAGDHINNNGDPSDARGTSRDEEPTDCGWPTNSLSCKNPKRNTIPSDVSKCELSGITDKRKYKETKPRSIQSKIQEGFSQLMKGNFVFREMNRDLSYVRRLPYKGFVGLPFISRSDSIDGRICSHHQKYLIFREELDDLRAWLRDNHFPEEHEKLEMTRQEFRELASRFARLVSAGKKEIDTIKFTNRKMIHTTLTEHQNVVMETERKHNVLFGDYGTGKTLVLTRKAASLASPSGNSQARSGEEQEVYSVGSTIHVVHIIPCADVSNFKSCYGVTFSDQSRDIEKFVKEENENINIYKSFHDFYVAATLSSPDPNMVVDTGMVKQAVRKITQNVHTRSGPVEGQQSVSKGNFDTREEYKNESEVASGERQKKKVVHHFFFDEFPIHPLKGGALKILQKFFLDHLQDSYLWISVATHSLGVSSEENPSNVLRKELSVEDGEDIMLCYLNEVMRVSGEVYKMIKQIETFIDKGHFQYSNLGHMVRGTKPRLFRLPSRKCEVFGNNPLGCECQVTNLASTLGRILDSAVYKDKPLVVTILIYYVMSTPMFRRLHALLTRVAQVLDIELSWNTMQSRYTEENCLFTDGLNHEVDLLPQGINDALENSSSVIDEIDMNHSEEALRSPCPAKGKKISEVKKQSSEWKIQVVDQRTFAGCETPFLIFIDPFGMRHWFKRGNGKGSGYHSLIFTRCTSQFNLITWPDGEAEKLWNQHLDEYEAEVKNSDASESYKQGRYEYINTGRKNTENCLQMLLAKDLIHNMTVEQTDVTT